MIHDSVAKCGKRVGPRKPREMRGGRGGGQCWACKESEGADVRAHFGGACSHLLHPLVLLELELLFRHVDRQLLRARILGDNLSVLYLGRVEYVVREKLGARKEEVG